MKCTTCTTELWGRPAVCPVCGTPTGLTRRSRRQVVPPWQAAAEAPAPAPAPSQPLLRASPSPSQPLFNAADLLDPDALEAVPHAPDAAAIFPTAPLSDSAPDSSQSGMLNAADLFDPEVLAELGAGDEVKPLQNDQEAPAQEEYPSLLEDASGGNQESNQDNRTGSPHVSSRSATGPIAPPLFTLTPLPAEPPPPLPPPLAPRDKTQVSGPLAPPEEMGWGPQRGWRAVSRPQPGSGPASRPAPLIPPEPPPISPFPMPAPPVPKTTARGRKGQRRFLGTLGGLMSLFLVLAIIGGAVLFGVTRYAQLQALQPKPAQATTAPLPTVAPRPGYTIYADQALGFSLQYANNWHRQADHDAADAQYQGDLFQAGPYAGLEVGSSPQYQRQNWNPAQIDDYILGKPFPLNNITSIQVSVPASPTVHIANLDWTAEDANLTLAGGITIRITCLAIQHNGRGYAIFYFAEWAVFSNYDIQFFEPMLLSFRFLNG